MRKTVVAITILYLSACDGPMLAIPGGALTGIEVSLRELALPENGGVIALETRPEDPYSVYVNVFVVEGRFFLDPTEDRKWYKHMVDDPKVRIGVGDGNLLYTALAVRETDPDITNLFEPDRIVVRLDPR